MILPYSIQIDQWFLRIYKTNNKTKIHTVLLFLNLDLGQKSFYLITSNFAIEPLVFKIVLLAWPIQDILLVVFQISFIWAYIIYTLCAIMKLPLQLRWNPVGLFIFELYQQKTSMQMCVIIEKFHSQNGVSLSLEYNLLIAMRSEVSLYLIAVLHAEF